MWMLKPKGALGPYRWRFVCHACGEKWAPGEVTCIPPGCCGKSQTHIHDLRWPCGLCAEHPSWGIELWLAVAMTAAADAFGAN